MATADEKVRWSWGWEWSLQRLLLAVLVAAVAACASGSSSRAEGTSRPGSSSDALTELPWLLPSELPADLAGTARRGVWSPAAERELQTYFGESGSEPFARRDVNVSVSEPSANELPGTIRVRGGLPADLVVGAVWDRTSRQLVWFEDGRVMRAATFTLSEDELKRFVENLRFVGGQPEMAEPMFGLQVIGRVHFPIYTDGYSVNYGIDRQRFLNITVHRSQPDEMATFMWAPTAPDTIAGKQARRYRPDRGAPPGFVWQIEPGVIVEVTGENLSEAELRSVASSLRRVDASEIEDVPGSRPS